MHHRLLIPTTTATTATTGTMTGTYRNFRHPDSTYQTSERSNAAQPVVPAANRIKPVVAINAKPEEELQDGKASSGGFGG